MSFSSSMGAPGVRIEWLDANAQQLDVGRTDVAGFLGLAERGPLHLPVKVESTRQFHSVFGGPLASACLAYGMDGFFANGGTTCWVVRVADPLAARPARLNVSLPGLSLLLEAITPGEWGNDIRVEPQWSANGVQALLVSEGTRRQRIDLDELRLAHARRPAPRPRSLLGVPLASLPELSENVLVKVIPDGQMGPGGWRAQASAEARLSRGANGLTTLRAEHFSGAAGDNAAPLGLAALNRIDGVSIVAAPDLMLSGFSPEAVLEVQLALLAHCMARHDRVVLLDLPNVNPSAALVARAKLPPTRFGAAYYPWIQVADPLGQRGDLRTIPPSAQVAGMMARCDRLRGVHKPPANELLEGVSALSHSLDQAAHALLNDAGVNAIRALPGRGVLVLGARTLEDDPTWRFLNVRRLFNMIEEALEEQMQWLTFEPNNPRLWKEVDRTVRGFLERLYRAGMLDGASSADAFSVRCDATTNPPSDTDTGRVVCRIGIQPPYPAEFVIVRIGITRNGIENEQKGALDG
jgi:hypothetical protein